MCIASFQRLLANFQSMKSSGRQSGSRGSPSQSVCTRPLRFKIYSLMKGHQRAGQTTQTRPRASNLVRASSNINERMHNNLYGSYSLLVRRCRSQVVTDNMTPRLKPRICWCVYCVILKSLKPPLTLLKKFIHVNASVKRATTEPVKRPTKRTKSAKQPEQPPQPVALQPFHVPKSTKAPNPIQMYLAHQAEKGERLIVMTHPPILTDGLFVKGTYPLQVSHGHLWVNFLAYASLHSLNVEKITPEMVRTVPC